MKNLFAAKDVVGLVDINNAKQVDKKETTEMGRRANHSTVSKLRYEEEREGSVYFQIRLLYNSAARKHTVWFYQNTQEKNYRTIDHQPPCFLNFYQLYVMTM